jgi:HlyD family secretion protein
MTPQNSHPGRARIALWGTLGALLALGLFLAFRPQAVPVDLTAAKRGPLRVTVDEEGETRVRDVFVLSAPVSGRAKRVELDVGEPVVAAETVVVEIEPIDPTLLDARSEIEGEAAIRAAEAALDLARSEVKRAEAELAFARSEFERQSSLNARGIVAERALDSARRELLTRRAAVDTARAALEERSFDLDRAKARLVSPLEAEDPHGHCECIPIHAPVSGRVLRVMHESEGVVQAGEPLVEIGDPADLEIVVDLLSADAVKVDQGQRVIIEEWGGEKPLEGRVRRIEPMGFTKVSALGIEEQRVNVIIDLVSPHEEWHRLGHGYRVEVRIVLWEDDDVLALPLSSFFRQDDGWAVFVVEDGVAHVRPVERGRKTGLRAQVVSGLEPGETVVLYPNDQVAEGVRVTQR